MRVHHKPDKIGRSESTINEDNLQQDRRLPIQKLQHCDPFSVLQHSKLRQGLQTQSHIYQENNRVYFTTDIGYLFYISTMSIDDDIIAANDCS